MLAAFAAINARLTFTSRRPLRDAGRICTRAILSGMTGRTSTAVTKRIRIGERKLNAAWIAEIPARSSRTIEY